LVLVKGDRRTGSQVSPTTQILVLKKEITRWDLKLTKKKERERKKRKKREGRENRKKILSKLSRQKDKFFFTKLTMQNIEEFCSVSIVKRGHLLLPNF